MNDDSDIFILADKKFSSRLLIGSGKFSSIKLMEQSLIASGSEIITMALRRIDLQESKDDFLESINKLPILFLPNTSGARDAQEAIRLAKLARKATGNKWVKLEVTPDPKYLLPDGSETLKAAKILVDLGFNVMPYINADPILANHLQEVGCVCVMPLGSPIGSNQGIKTQDQIAIIIEQAQCPVIVDAGIGAPSHASLAMEMGADAVLVNTAIATAQNPVMVARAFKHAVMAGRWGYHSKLPITKNKGEASSPLNGFLD
jgi:thiazole synthase